MTPAEAARFIIGHFEPLAAAPRPLRECLGAVLAEDVASPLDLPPWDNSAMDGYAVRSADAPRPVELSVVETVHAGQVPRKSLGPGEATRVFTGAPLPQGADTVIRQEDTTLVSPERVAINDTRDLGKNVRRRGEDIKRGSIVFARSTELGPAQLGVLAAIACDAPVVHRAPRVAFVGSGDEIADLDQKGDILAGKKIASSSTYTVDAQLRALGAVPVGLGIARDTKESLRSHLERARGVDLVVTTAGVSVGERDFVRDVIRELGGEVKMWRVAMRPGGPMGFGTLHGKPWIGLPGNPVSTMVTFEVFVRPAIRRMAGHRLPFRRTVPVRVAEPITLGPKLRHFLRVTLEQAEPGGPLTARLTGPQGSGILTSMARAHALLIVPEDQAAVAPGATLQALVLDDARHVAEPAY